MSDPVFNREHVFVKEAEDLVLGVLSGGEEDIKKSILASVRDRPNFSCIIDDYAEMSSIVPTGVLLRLCRSSGPPLLNLGALKIPREQQYVVDGIPALLACRTSWGAMSFVTPVPFLDKTGAAEVLRKAYGALKVSFAYCTSSDFSGLYEKLLSAGRVSSTPETAPSLSFWWDKLVTAGCVTGECPPDVKSLIAALPKIKQQPPEVQMIIATLTAQTPYIEFSRSAVDEDLPLLPPATQKHYGITPISYYGSLCTLACEKALTARERGELSTKGLRFGFFLSDPEKIRQAITDWEARRLSASDIARRIEVDDQKEEHVIEEIDITDLVRKSGEDNPTVVELVQSIIVYGVQNNATDIHISTHPTRMWVRFRIDGFLSDYPNPLETKLCRQVISRIKIMANIDTQYSPIPQDGKFSISFQKREFDIRVNTAPTVYGDKAILRLLPKRFRLPTLEDLGFGPHERDIVSKVVASDHGLLVICGPTGAGKSTTLAAAIGMIDSTRYVVVTGEQPVEMRIPNIEQTNVTASVENPGGLTFARFLEASLRQDPDYIMIGETRDTETSSQVVRAALTGHVVMTTLHTNSAATAPGRLIDLGAQPFLLKEALSSVVAQRLLPRLCTNCAVSIDPPTDEEIANMGIRREWFRERETFLSASGCAMCRNTGYSGRIGIFEGFTIDREIRSAISEKGGNISKIRDAMKAQGGRSLLEQGCFLAAKGTTDIVSALTMRSEDDHGH